MFWLFVFIGAAAGLIIMYLIVRGIFAFAKSLSASFYAQKPQSVEEIFFKPIR